MVRAHLHKACIFSTTTESQRWRSPYREGSGSLDHNPERHPEATAEHKKLGQKRLTVKVYVYLVRNKLTQCWFQAQLLCAGRASHLVYAENLSPDECGTKKDLPRHFSSHRLSSLLRGVISRLASIIISHDDIELPSKNCWPLIIAGRAGRHSNTRNGRRC
jgi:hypothetical protein